MRANYFYVLVGFIIDGILAALFPVDFGSTGMYFIPCVGFVALVLTLRKTDSLIDGLIMSALFGILYDFLYTGEYFLYFFIFMIACFIVRAWNLQINNSVVEQLVLCEAVIFIRELLVFLYVSNIGRTSMGINTWLTHRMFLTLLVNGVFIILQIYASALKDEYIISRETKIRKEEKIDLLFKK